MKSSRQNKGIEYEQSFARRLWTSFFAIFSPRYGTYIPPERVKEILEKSDKQAKRTEETLEESKKIDEKYEQIIKKL